MVENTVSEGNNSAELTEQESELYDRQIRLWGMDSQKRLRAARVLICGMNGFGAEIAKNVVLAGIKTITFLDDKNVSEFDSYCQFLIPLSSIGKNRALECLPRAQRLNQMVEMKADTDKLADKPDSFFQEFDVVVVIEAPISEQIRINEICRNAGIKYFAGDVWGMSGYYFADLQQHDFAEDVFKHKIISKPREKLKTELVSSVVKKTLNFPPLKDCLDFDVTSPEYLKKVKRTGPGFIAVKILQKFRENEKRDPNPNERDSEIEILKKMRDDIVSSEIVPDTVFENIFCQISPAAAVVGGALSQEVIKTISQKEAPHQNYFIFDSDRCVGFIETIGV